MPSRMLQRGFKAENIGECLYKIRDNNIRPRHFLGANNKDEKEAILSDHKGYSLHKYIDGDESL
ncbi:5890_t:CDS:2 [Funneliformis geosporum]|uniref:5890_t:CDS:1 n=1 Tax=Funneliformis geosporum TaxID=1117311 RepID=A0A9W4SKL1_9GLOM|nr:5890_t:CDS:2 [Funneliformis geosporum]